MGGDTDTTALPEANKGSSNSSSGRDTANGQHGVVPGGSQESLRRQENYENDHCSEGNTRKSYSYDPEEREEKAGDMDDTEYRRMRRRITNRESAKRMRVKRQEEMAAFQEELKKQAADIETLRKYTAYLQSQLKSMASDVQHWQSKYASANAEVAALFLQLQQVVALSAAFDPTILEAVGASTSSQTQSPTLEALMQALPQVRMLSEAMGALSTSRRPLAQAPTPPSSLSSLSTPPCTARPLLHTIPATRVADASQAAGRGEEQLGSVPGSPQLPQIVQPKPFRPKSAALLHPSPRAEPQAQAVKGAEGGESEVLEALRLMRKARVPPRELEGRNTSGLGEALRLMSSALPSAKYEDILNAAQQLPVAGSKRGASTR